MITNDRVQANTPLSLTELAQLLNTSQDVGLICTSDNINMWSKRKPFVSNKLFFEQDSDATKTDRDTALYNANYGLTAPTKRSNTTINNCATDMWVYNKPSGGASSPYRIADFYGYFHKAAWELSGTGDVEINIYHRDTAVLCSRKETITQQGASIEIADLKDFANMRLGLYVEKVGDPSNQRVKINSSLITADTNEMTISYSELNSPISNQFKYVVAATSINSNDGALSSVFGSGNWIALPRNSVAEFSGIITISGDFHINCTTNGYDKSGQNTWLTSTKYWGQTQAETGGDLVLGNNYYTPDISKDYTMSLRYAMRNDADYDITLYKNKFGASITNNLYSDSETSKLPLQAMYDENGNEVDSITIKSGETKNVGFLLHKYIFTCDYYGVSQGIVQERKDPRTSTIKFYYNNNDSVVISQIFRIQG